jgi:hypothetical protein
VARGAQDETLAFFTLKNFIKNQFEAAGRDRLACPGFFFFSHCVKDLAEEFAEGVGPFVILNEKKSISSNLFAPCIMEPPLVDLVALLLVEPHSQFARAAFLLELFAKLDGVLFADIQQSANLKGNLIPLIFGDAAGIRIEMELGDIDHKGLRCLRVSELDRCVGIEKSPFERFSHQELMLGLGLLCPLLPFDDLDLEELDDQKTKQSKDEKRDPDQTATSLGSI